MFAVKQPPLAKSSSQVSVTLGSRDVRMYPGASSEYVSVFIQSGWNAGDLLAY
jgi:hypothetical protein